MNGLVFKKLHPDAKAPKQMLPGDAGYDITAVSSSYDIDTNIVTYETGLAIVIPEGYVGLLFMRSSVYKTGLTLCNATVVLDSQYRGPVSAKFTVNNPDLPSYIPGDRIIQLVIVPHLSGEFNEVNELPVTQRGVGGYGSTGRG
jgi:dUTP pyrophosphatase